MRKTQTSLGKGSAPQFLNFFMLGCIGQAHGITLLSLIQFSGQHPLAFQQVASET